MIAVIRHRGGGMDDDGNPIPSTDTELAALAVAPGANPDYLDRGRNGQRVECSVYFSPAVDLVGTDELTVDGQRYWIAVEQWRPRADRPGRRTGTLALCSRGEG
ncbi:hypothetical protein IU451_30195 [Nocardia cyriacigeorgica]|uniref:hypothetical protein n=1 Tax=Nocardia cyriacigeorgica TaxID=135487 RepID=UPI00189352EB|nr:hypothetical protein [Nocardia cyriacigeorgica]MBF6326770.1 hypothetical protein [Nocardia cyriacigeorgica]